MSRADLCGVGCARWAVMPNFIVAAPSKPIEDSASKKKLGKQGKEKVAVTSSFAHPGNQYCATMFAHDDHIYLLTVSDVAFQCFRTSNTSHHLKQTIGLEGIHPGVAANTFGWEAVIINGKAPSPRRFGAIALALAAPTLAVTGEAQVAETPTTLRSATSIFIMGGLAFGHAAMDDLGELKIGQDVKWNVLSVTPSGTLSSGKKLADAPYSIPARWNHAMCLCGTKLFVFGGASIGHRDQSEVFGSCETMLGDLAWFDTTKSGHWHLIKFVSDYVTNDVGEEDVSTLEPSSCMGIESSTHFPLPRQCHSMACTDSKIFVYGGLHFHRPLERDLWFVDAGAASATSVSLRRWTKVDLPQCPHPVNDVRFSDPRFDWPTANTKLFCLQTDGKLLANRRARAASLCETDDDEKSNSVLQRRGRSTNLEDHSCVRLLLFGGTRSFDLGATASLDCFLVDVLVSKSANTNQSRRRLSTFGDRTPLDSSIGAGFTAFGSFQQTVMLEEIQDERNVSPSNAVRHHHNRSLRVSHRGPIDSETEASSTGLAGVKRCSSTALALETRLRNHAQRDRPTTSLHSATLLSTLTPNESGGYSADLWMYGGIVGIEGTMDFSVGSIELEWLSLSDASPNNTVVVADENGVVG